jgi:hypothetical protein
MNECANLTGIEGYGIISFALREALHQGRPRRGKEISPGRADPTKEKGGRRAGEESEGRTSDCLRVSAEAVRELAGSAFCMSGGESFGGAL